MLAYYQGWNHGMVKILHGNVSNASQGCDSTNLEEKARGLKELEPLMYITK